MDSSKLTLNMVQVSVLFVVLSVVQAAWGSAINKNVGVYGGEFINIEEAPFMSLLYTSEDIPCGGTIIARQFILTVSNCCNDARVPVNQWKARVATDGRNGGGSSFRITDFYKFNKTGTDYNLKPTLCIVKLAVPLRFGPKINKVDLNEQDTVLVSGTLVDFTAFGRPKLTEVSRGLRRSQLPIADPDWCKEENKRLGGGQICAGDHDRNACAGDAGGALTYGNYLIGVLSEATSDCYSNPSRFCRISHFRDWIKNTISS